jgi:hypothetical protein
MFDIKESDHFDTTEKLLFNIWQELRILNGAKKAPAKQIPAKKLLTKPQSDSEKCKYCGGTHENKGQFLACARKHSTKKKEGTKNVGNH